jgi:hypothetical protein
MKFRRTCIISSIVSAANCAAFDDLLLFIDKIVKVFAHDQKNDFSAFGIVDINSKDGINAARGERITESAKKSSWRPIIVIADQGSLDRRRHAIMATVREGCNQVQLDQQRRGNQAPVYHCRTQLALD